MPDIKKRIVDEAEHIIKTKEIIRQNSQIFNISKSSIHNDIQNKLKKLNNEIYEKMNPIMQDHIEKKHNKNGNL